MGRYEKKRKPISRFLPYILIILLTLVLVVAAGLIAAFLRGDLGARPPQNNPSYLNGAADADGLPLLTIDAIVEQEDMMLVRTSYCTLKYPYAFSDVIELTTDATDLNFFANINDTQELLFTLCFYSTDGISVGNLERDGVMIPVSVKIYDTQQLEGESLTTYLAAQETLNEILSSLEENENFHPV